MGRKRRLWFPGATYHIMCRGNYRQNIFRDIEDYKVFLQLLENIKKKNAFELHSFSCMTNHYHILIETDGVDIWFIMQRINQLYAAYFNTKYELRGHLFQGRYKSVLVKNEAYFLQTSKYIHRNPVNAFVVYKPEDYAWSSYRTYIGLEKNALVTKDKVLSYFNENRGETYREFVEKPTNLEQEKNIQIEIDE